MNRALFLQTWRSQWLKLLAVSVALLIWGSLMPVIYGAFGQDIKGLFGRGALPPQLAAFGGGDLFSLGGMIALGFIHPITVALSPSRMKIAEKLAMNSRLGTSTRRAPTPSFRSVGVTPITVER